MPYDSQRISIIDPATGSYLIFRAWVLIQALLMSKLYIPIHIVREHISRINQLNQMAIVTY